MDVVYALKRQGRTLYGFGGWTSNSDPYNQTIGPFQGHHIFQKSECYL
jgi:hypothetical protein